MLLQDCQRYKVVEKLVCCKLHDRVCRFRKWSSWAVVIFRHSLTNLRKIVIFLWYLIHKLRLAFREQFTSESCRHFHNSQYISLKVSCHSDYVYLIFNFDSPSEIRKTGIPNSIRNYHYFHVKYVSMLRNIGIICFSEWYFPHACICHTVLIHVT